MIWYCFFRIGWTNLFGMVLNALITLAGSKTQRIVMKKFTATAVALVIGTFACAGDAPKGQAPAAPAKAEPKTVLVPKTVLKKETVMVPKTVLKKETVMVPVKVVECETCEVACGTRLRTRLGGRLRARTVAAADCACCD